LTHNTRRHYPGVAGNLICQDGSILRNAAEILLPFALLLPTFKWFTLFGLKVYQLGKCIYLIHRHTQTTRSGRQTDRQTGNGEMGKCGEMVGKAEETGGGADASRRKLNDCAHEVTQHSNAHFTPFSKVCLRRYHAETQAHTAEEASFSSFHPAFPPHFPPDFLRFSCGAAKTPTTEACVRDAFVYNCRRYGNVCNFGLNEKTLKLQEKRF